jgi:hypothetical protein
MKILLLKKIWQKTRLYLGIHTIYIIYTRRDIRDIRIINVQEIPKNTMIIFYYLIQSIGKYKYKVPFHNISGGVDIKICEDKLETINKDKILQLLRKKLNDQSITDILYLSTKYTNNYDNNYFNIIIRNNCRIKLLNIFSKGKIEITSSSYTSDDFVDKISNQLLKTENRILFDDYIVMKYMLLCNVFNSYGPEWSQGYRKNFGHLYKYLSDRLHDNYKLAKILTERRFCHYGSGPDGPERDMFDLDNFKCASDRVFWDNKKNILRIIKNFDCNSWYKFYILLSDRLKCDIDIIEKCINGEIEYIEIINYITQSGIYKRFDWISNKTLIFEKLEYRLSVLYRWLPDNLKCDPDILSLAFDKIFMDHHNDYIIPYLPYELLSNKNFMLGIIKKLCVKHNYNAKLDIYKYISDELKYDLDIFRQCICFNTWEEEDSIHYIIDYIHSTGIYLGFIWLADKQIILGFKYCIFFVYRWLPENLKNDPDILESMLKRTISSKHDIYIIPYLPISDTRISE